MPSKVSFHSVGALAALIGALTLCLGATGYLFINKEVATLREGVHARLQEIAAGKVRKVVAWREGLLADASRMLENYLFMGAIRERISSPTSRAEVLTWMESYRRREACRSVLYLDDHGEVLLSTPPEAGRVGPQGMAWVSEALRVGKPRLSDLHRGAVDQDLHIDLDIPLPRSESEKRPFGCFLIRVDPHRGLFPMVRSWLTSSPTAECLLVTRQAGRVVILSEARVSEGTMALSSPSLPSGGLEAGARDGVSQGIDYRGMTVLAATAPVPGTAWHLVAKVDRDEAYGPIWDQARRSSLLVALLVTGCSLIATLIWLRSRAGTALREAIDRNKLLDDVLTALPDEAYRFDAGGRLSYANRQGFRALVRRREEEAGRCWRELGFPTDVFLRLSADLSRVTSTGEAISSRASWPSPAGSRHVEYVLSPIHDQKGELESVACAIRDVTEQVRSAELLGETQERLEMIIRAGNVGLWDWNLVSGEFYFAPLLKAMFGYQDHEIPNRFEEFESRIHPQDHDRVVEAIRGYLEGSLPTYEVEMRIRHRNGSYRSGLSRGSVIRAPGGQPLRFMGCWVDLSEGKEMERSLLLTQFTVDRAPAGVVWAGPEGRIRYVNDAACRLAGRPRESLAGRHLEEMDPALGGEGWNLLWSDLAPGATRSFESILRRDDGSSAPIEVVAARLEFQGEEMAVLFKRDVSERNRMLEEIQAFNRELERRVVERTAQLEAANREIEAFSYSVSHDLRAPLRSIDGFSLALLEDCGERLDAPGKEHLGRIRRAARTMGELIDGLLSLSRLTRSEMKMEEVDLGEIAESILSDLRAAEPSRCVEFSCAPGLRTRGDRQLLRVLLKNLLENAWKFTSRRERARIELGSHEGPEGREEFFVRDDGAGFDMAYAGKLFGTFQRLHPQNEYPGSGVGLATVLRVVRRHGGTVRAEGELEKGATFYFAV